MKNIRILPSMFFLIYIRNTSWTQAPMSHIVPTASRRPFIPRDAKAGCPAPRRGRYTEAHACSRRLGQEERRCLLVYTVKSDSQPVELVYSPASHLQKVVYWIWLDIFSS